MSNDQQRGDQREEQYEEQRDEANIRDVSSDDGSTTQEERRTCVCIRFPFLEADYSEERAVELSNWALEKHIQDYSDECFGSFVWKVIESKDHTTLVEVQSYFGFVVTTWTKVGTPGSQQLNSVRKFLDRNVHKISASGQRGGC